MQELITTTGIVLKSEPIDEYDRRIVLLTTDHGKISAFARGARRQTNRLMASTDLFCFGDYKLYPGRNSYSVSEAFVKNYFESLRNDFNKAMYGMYFLEVMDFDTRENCDEKDKLKLLYQALRALLKAEISDALIKAVFEIKCLMLDGEFKYNAGINDSKTLLYTLEFLYKTPADKVFSFMVDDNVIKELSKVALDSRMKQWNSHVFNSEEMLKVIEM